MQLVTSYLTPDKETPPNSSLLQPVTSSLMTDKENAPKSLVPPELITEKKISSFNHLSLCIRPTTQEFGKLKDPMYAYSAVN